VKGLPYLPKRDFIFAFHSEPFKSYVHRRLESYHVWGIPEKEGYRFSGIKQRYRTGYKHLWRYIDILQGEFGTLIGARIDFGNEFTPPKVLQRPLTVVRPASSDQQPYLPKFGEPKVIEPSLINLRNVRLILHKKKSSFSREGLGHCFGLGETTLNLEGENFIAFYSEQEHEVYGNWIKTIRLHNLTTEYGHMYQKMYYVVPCSILIKGWERIGKELFTE